MGPKRASVDSPLFPLRSVISVLASVCLAITEMGVAGAVPQQGASIRVVSGNNLELVAGSNAIKVVTVEVDDVDGKPLAGVPVTFTFPQQGSPGGVTELNQFLSTAITDTQGLASVRLKASGPVGAWTLRVRAGSAAATIALTNVAQETPTNAAANGPGGTTAPQPPPHKSHLALILLVVAGAAGGGIGAALAGKKGGSSGTTINPGPSPNPTSTTISITTSGAGSFGVP